MQKTKRAKVRGIVHDGEAELIMALIIQDVPPGYDWGWYSREDPRMHVQTVDEKHFKQYKVWLERDGQRVFEPAEVKLKGKKFTPPRKMLDALREEVAAYREHLEARWVRLMISKRWIRLHMAGSVVTLNVYPNFPTGFTRTIDLAEEFPGFYDPEYPMTPKEPFKREDVTLSETMAAIEIWPQKDIADREHIFLPPIIWRD